MSIVLVCAENTSAAAAKRNQGKYRAIVIETGNSVEAYGSWARWLRHVKFYDIGASDINAATR